jgi:hypothetical protein
MANETVITSPVKIVSDSSSRVAFDLMVHIGLATYHTDQTEQKTKNYWLKLYRQCYKATTGYDQKSILKE